MVGVTPSALGITQFLNSMPPCILFSVGSTLLMKAGGENAMVPATHGFLLFAGLFLHFVSMIALAYASSFIAKDGTKTKNLPILLTTSVAMQN